MCFTPQQIYEDACSGLWAELDPKRCPCKGKGWMLSNVDTWHQCPVHGNGVMHPEEAEYQAEIQEEIEYEAKKAGITVEQYLKLLEEIEEAQKWANDTKDDDNIPF